MNADHMHEVHHIEYLPVQPGQLLRSREVCRCGSYRIVITGTNWMTYAGSWSVGMMQIGAGS